MTAPQPPTRSGLYRTPADLERARVALEAAGMAWIDVRLKEASDKKDIIRALGHALGARGNTFGDNWDALADVLQDMAWRPANGYAIHLRQSDAAVQGPAWPTLRRVLRESAAYWKTRGKPFVVLVDGGDEKLEPWI